MFSDYMVLLFFMLDKSLNQKKTHEISYLVTLNFFLSPPPLHFTYIYATYYFSPKDAPPFPPKKDTKAETTRKLTPTLLPPFISTEMAPPSLPVYPRFLPSSTSSTPPPLPPPPPPPPPQQPPQQQHTPSSPSPTAATGHPKAALHNEASPSTPPPH